MKVKIVVIDLEVSAAAKRWVLRAGIPLAFLLGGGAVAWAAGIHTWKDNDTLSAGDLNSSFQYVEQQIVTLQTQVAAMQPQGVGLVTVGAFVEDTANGATIGTQNPYANPWLTSAARNSIGNVTLNVAPTVFGTHTPNCTATASNGVIAGIQGLSATQIIVTLASASGAPADSWIEVTCVGQPP